MKALRTQILEAFSDFVRREIEMGHDGCPLRAITRGPWQPGALPAPSLTITDAGKRRMEEYSGDGEVDSRTTIQSTLSVAGVLDLPAQWDRDGGADAYAKLVEDIESLTITWADSDPNARALGVTAARMMSDEPLEAVLTRGASQQIWMMELEIDFASALDA